MSPPHVFREDLILLQGAWLNHAWRAGDISSCTVHQAVLPPDRALPSVPRESMSARKHHPYLLVLLLFGINLGLHHVFSHCCFRSHLRVESPPVGNRPHNNNNNVVCCWPAASQLFLPGLLQAASARFVFQKSNEAHGDMGAACY